MLSNSQTTSVWLLPLTTIASSAVLGVFSFPALKPKNQP